MESVTKVEIDAETRHVEIRLTNKSDQPMGVVLEPWGEIYQLEPRTVYKVSADGPPGDTIEVEVENGWVTVWAPRDSSLEICKADDGTDPKAVDDNWEPPAASRIERLEKVGEPKAQYPADADD